jgi:hypothetical protein
MNETPKNLEQKIDTIESMISFAKQKFVTQDATSLQFYHKSIPKTSSLYPIPNQAN